MDVSTQLCLFTLKNKIFIYNFATQNIIYTKILKSGTKCAVFDKNDNNVVFCAISKEIIKINTLTDEYTAIFHSNHRIIDLKIDQSNLYFITPFSAHKYNFKVFTELFANNEGVYTGIYID